MADQEITTAAELDAITPAERHTRTHTHFLAAEVTVPTTLPKHYWKRLAAQA